MISNLYQRRLLPAIFLMILCFAACFPLAAQNSRVVEGTILDEQSNPIDGATLQVKETNISATSDKNGKFSLTVPANRRVIVVSYVGKATQEVTLGSQNRINVTLANVITQMDDVVVVGYGRQTKASVVASIAQTTGKELERAGGVNNLGQALTGNLPGLVTTASSGQPGAEDPRILIRAQTSFSNNDVLILVDGIERPGSLGTIDVSSVESISILKDASATAVYGVKGANGVILITTKKGVAGKPTIRLRTNMTVKTASKVPGKYDAYDALALRNIVILREVNQNPSGWGNMRPYEILDKYRNPANTAEWDRYPNVDWYKELFKNSAQSYNASVNISGGSQFVTYFTTVDYTYEGDLFKTIQNNRGYTPGFGYQRINMRSNLDFNLTKTTKFTTRLFGSNGTRKTPYGMADGDNFYFKSAYQVSPEAFRPVYSDGVWGYFPGKDFDIPNSLFSLAVSGIEKRTNTQLTTDFVLEQQLSMLTKGLTARVSFSFDNTFSETGRGLSDGSGPQRKYIDPVTGVVSYQGVVNSGTQIDFAEQINWVNQAGSVNNGATYRRLNYIGQLNYSRRFGKHDVGGLALFQRERVASGSAFPAFREDWVFRATYSYANKYLFETNGAYNGTEKFGPDYRFQFFPSVSLGWTVSNEKFISDNVSFLNLLKIRASWGKVGSDAGSPRFGYVDQWSFGGNYPMGYPSVSNTPYTFYRISSLGNPNLSWETVEKRNLGVDFSVLNGKIGGSVDVFKDMRRDVFIGGGDRAIPSYFGAGAPNANLGRANGTGYEIELRLNQLFKNGLRVTGSVGLTHAESKTIFRDDAELLDSYRKQAGFPIGQTRSYQDYGFLQSWDDMYGSTQRSTNDGTKYVGDYNILDFNGDGTIDQADNIPLKYTAQPQNTYNATIGLEWKGFTLFAQFYGVNNVTREVYFPTFDPVTNVNVAYEEGVYWMKANGGGDVPLPRLAAGLPFGANGTRYLYDGSYIRLKNAEIAYNINGKRLNRLGIKSCRIYANGNNLALWTKMPDDRESNFGGNGGGGAYPTMKRFNLGIDINL